ncbi:MAG: hypothetical protein ABMA64_06425 [Myxococcota bacterium]
MWWWFLGAGGGPAGAPHGGPRGDGAGRPRFRWRDVRALLPPEWAPEVALEPAAAIRPFFAAEP